MKSLRFRIGFFVFALALAWMGRDGVRGVHPRTLHRGGDGTPPENKGWCSPFSLEQESRAGCFVSPDDEKISPMMAQGVLSKVLALLLAAALSFILVGCSASTSIRLLDAVVVSAEVAVSSLGSAGAIDPAVAAKINAYLNSVGAASDRVGAILQAHATTPNPRLAADITAVFAGVALDPAVTASLPGSLRVVVVAVGLAVNSFLGHYPVPSQGLTASRVQPEAAAKLKLSGADKAALARIRARAGLVIQRTK